MTQPEIDEHVSTETFSAHTVVQFWSLNTVVSATHCWPVASHEHAHAALPATRFEYVSYARG